MGEVAALKFLAERFRVTQKEVFTGIGDDSAVADISEGTSLVVSTDTLVEDVHFRLQQNTARQIGRKAVAVSLSDIGAMGAVPKYLLCSIGCRSDAADEFIKEFSEGVAESCGRFGVFLIGGNLSESKTVFVNMTALGETFKETVIRRRGATLGDLICVTGTLGDSAMGLAAISRGVAEDSDGFRFVVSRHLDPEPRLGFGRSVAQRGIVSSMIDISDGLFSDLEKLTSNFGLGAEIRLDDIPLSPHIRSLSLSLGEDPYEFAVSGGEDYEILFTSAAENSDALKEVSSDCGVSVSEIGRVTRGNTVRFFDDSGQEVFFGTRGFSHFR